MRRGKGRGRRLTEQFVIVDCEHGNIDDGEMYNSVAGVASCGVSPIVRIAEPTVGSIKRALDTGAQ